MALIRTYYAAIKSIDNPETGWDPVGSWNKVHGDGKSSTNVLRMQGQLGGDGVHKVRIVSGGGKNLVVRLEGAVAAPFGEAQIRATILAAFQVKFFLFETV
jgi:hypothetical protein